MANSRRTILVVEDEPKLVRLLETSLRADGYEVWKAQDGQAALTVLRERFPDLIILDIGLPGEIDGYEVCRQVRRLSNIPTIILTAHAREADKLRGFEVGADDYVTKPFSYPELRARVNAVLQRTLLTRSGVASPRFQAGDLEIDHLGRRVFMAGQEVHLTPTEYALLEQMAINEGKVLLHEDLLAHVWGAEYRDEYQYLRNYISNLRRKIEPDPARPRYIRSKPGVGYFFTGQK